MARRLRTVGLAVLVALTAGCGGYQAHVRVVRANYNVARGEFQAAIVDYLRAGDAGSYGPWIAYNLGNVFYYLGETGAAAEQWSDARVAASDDLMYGATFNRGVYLYETGRFEDALRAFRAALLVAPGDVAAKRNLELTIDRLSIEAAPAVDEATDPSGADRVGQRMLDFVRRKEEQRWQARSSDESPVAPGDW